MQLMFKMFYIENLNCHNKSGFWNLNFCCAYECTDLPFSSITLSQTFITSMYSYIILFCVSSNGELKSGNRTEIYYI